MPRISQFNNPLDITVSGTAYGYPDYDLTQTLNFTASTTASGITLTGAGRRVYEFSATEDCVAYFDPINRGIAHKGNSLVYAFGNNYRISTTASPLVVVVSGLNAAGTFTIAQVTEA